MSSLPSQRLNTVIQSLKPISSDNLNDVNAIVQKKLREAANRLGWSDLEVANKAGLPQSTVYRLLNAKTANPSFSLVLKLCHTLGVAMPFSGGLDYPKRPLDYLIGTPLPTDKSMINHEWIHCLPELQSFKIGKVENNCANHKYPKGSLLFFSLYEGLTVKLKTNDTLIIKISKSNKEKKLIPMMLLENPIKNPDTPDYMLHHLTNRKRDQFIVSMNLKYGISQHNGYSFELFGKIHKAII